MIYIYSPLKNSFFPLSLKELYTTSGAWPDDGIEVEENVFIEFSQANNDKIRAAGDDGLPCWVAIPPPSHDELVAAAKRQKTSLIDAANAFINNHNWPSKLALGRLSTTDKTRFNEWLDYIDAVAAVDVSIKPEAIDWPVTPL